MSTLDGRKTEINPGYTNDSVELKHASSLATAEIQFVEVAGGGSPTNASEGNDLLLGGVTPSIGESADAFICDTSDGGFHDLQSNRWVIKSWSASGDADDPPAGNPDTGGHGIDVLRGGAGNDTRLPPATATTASADPIDGFPIHTLGGEDADQFGFVASSGNETATSLDIAVDSACIADPLHGPETDELTFERGEGGLGASTGDDLLIWNNVDGGDYTEFF